MGHQESYVRVKDSSKFNDLVETTKELGKDFFNCKDIEPVEIITLNKTIEGDLSYMCKPEQRYKFDKGEQFIYFIGDRSYQRSTEFLYGNKPPKGLEIYYAECFPSEEIFNKESGYATTKEFDFELELEMER